MKNTQINIALPEHWRIELERLARIYSVEEEETLTYLDLVRRAIITYVHEICEARIHTALPCGVSIVK